MVTTDRSRIVLCDNDELFHLTFEKMVKRFAHVTSTLHLKLLEELLSRKRFDLVLLDISMNTPTEGLDGLNRVLALAGDTPVVMISGLNDYESLRRALRGGASDFLFKGLEEREIVHSVRRLLEHEAVSRKRVVLSHEIERARSQNTLVGSSIPLVKLRGLIDRVRASTVNVLITGESGTGKELVAQALRRKLPDGTLEPFVCVDASTIQGSLAESILFGHEKGAFTGAERSTSGLFEEASGGTVYFDELANMPLDLQSKLLRVLQEKRVRRVGSTREIELDFRVIGATNRNMDQECAEGRFRFDLLQRIGVFPIELPPLRERREDIPELVSHLLTKLSSKDRSVSLTDDALAALMQYDWPGNVRELSNALAYALTVSDDTRVTVNSFPAKVLAFGRKTSVDEGKTDGFYGTVAEFERDVLARAFREHGGVVAQVARSLKMDRSHLHAKLKAFGIR